MTPFDTAVAFTLREEGGFTDDPRDPGGATNLGITLATLTHWRGRPATADDVRQLTVVEADAADFGRGWLARLTRCTARAIDLAASPP